MYRDSEDAHRRFRGRRLDPFLRLSEGSTPRTVVRAATTAAVDVIVDTNISSLLEGLFQLRWGRGSGVRYMPHVWNR